MLESTTRQDGQLVYPTVFCSPFTTDGSPRQCKLALGVDPFLLTLRL